MTFDALNCFCAIVELGSFRKAAERVHRSQPAVSQQLKSLEQSLGHRLIDRKKNAPTPFGKRFYARAKEILLGVEGLIQEAADYRAGIGRELRVGTSDTTALYVLPPYIRRFRERMPETRLELVQRSSGAIVDQVVEGRLDFGLVTLPQHHEALEEEALFAQQFVLVIPKRHPLAQRKKVSLDFLRQEPFLMIDGGTRTGGILRSYFYENDFQPQVMLDSGSFEVIKRYVAEGVGVSFLPDMVLGKEDRQLVTLGVPGLPKISFGSGMATGAYVSQAQQLLMALLRGAPDQAAQA